MLKQGLTSIAGTAFQGKKTFGRKEGTYVKTNMVPYGKP